MLADGVGNVADLNGDGKVDCADPKCFKDVKCAGGLELCDDRIDNNGDGATGAVIQYSFAGMLGQALEHRRTHEARRGGGGGRDHFVFRCHDYLSR